MAATMTITPSPSVEAYCLHYRMGHPALNKLQSISSLTKHVTQLPCETCELGKHHKVSFPSHFMPSVTNPFQIDHDDVMDPYNVTDVLSFKY